MGLLNIDDLLNEISPDAPCGEDLEYDPAFVELELKAKGTPEQQIGDRVEPSQPPNWRELRKETLALLERTRDLRLLLGLTRAMLNTEGLAGLQESLALILGALENYWDSIHPQLDPDDDNDPTYRVNILMELCDFDGMLRPLSLVPVVESRAVGRFSLRDIQIAGGKQPPSDDGEAVEMSTIQAAFTDADIDALQSTRQSVDGALSSLTAIETFVTDQVGVGNAPSLAPLREPLREILQVLNEQSARRGIGMAGGEQETIPEAGGAATVAASGPMGGVNNRQDVIRALDLICEYYSRAEPSSPVPLLLMRAKRLVTKGFLEIMRDLAPDGVSQVELIGGIEPEE